MSNFTLTYRIFFLVFSYLGITALPGYAQDTQHATSVVPTPLNTADAANAADSDVNSFSTLRPGLVVANQSAIERVQFASVVPSNNNSGLTMQVNNLSGNVANNLLGAAVLNNIVITAFLNGQSVGQWKLGSLLKLNVLTAGQKQTLNLAPAPSSDFNQLEVAVDGTLNAYSVNFFDAFAPASNVGPLPVVLAGFQGKATAAGVQLSWQTASELHSSHFVVERASGGEAPSFEAIGQVAAAGSSAQARSYQYRDAEPLALGYYRLRQVDTDGKITFSPVVAVQAASAAATVAPLAAYPSPATETVQFTGLANSQVAIYDQQGRRLLQATVGEPLDVRNLPAGLYLVRDAATGSSTRFVKSL